MGLDISHGAWRGGYGSFHNFRITVCMATGGRFEDDAEGGMFYFGEGYTRTSHPGLFEFIGHSDCDGSISPKLAKKLAKELEQLLPELECFGDGPPHIRAQGGYDGCARKLIAGCRKAARAGEPLVFG